jgi:CRP/FNR family transcriptional regulator, cyclic AMP receptor protein
MADLNMQSFSRDVGVSVSYPAGGVVFAQGDPAGSMFVIQSGTVEILLGDQVVDICGPNEMIGFMSVIDGGARTSTARVKAAAELSAIDRKKFEFMLDEVPNFSRYVLKSMADRIRGITQAI